MKFLYKMGIFIVKYKWFILIVWVIIVVVIFILIVINVLKFDNDIKMIGLKLLDMNEKIEKYFN